MARGVRRAEIWTVSAFACAARFAANSPTASALAQLPTNARSAANRAHAQLTDWHILRKQRCCPGAPGSWRRPYTSFKPREIAGPKRSVCSAGVAE